MRSVTPETIRTALDEHNIPQKALAIEASKRPEDLSRRLCSAAQLDAHEAWKMGRAFGRLEERRKYSGRFGNGAVSA